MAKKGQFSWCGTLFREQVSAINLTDMCRQFAQISEIFCNNLQNSSKKKLALAMGFCVSPRSEVTPEPNLAKPTWFWCTNSHGVDRYNCAGGLCISMYSECGKSATKPHKNNFTELAGSWGKTCLHPWCFWHWLPSDRWLCNSQGGSEAAQRGL